MNKTNQHRQHKFPFQAYLIPAEQDVITKAKQELGVKTNRELIVRLSKDYLSDIEQA
tara:strand:- start:9780 stop:9950 length:171 start_codon:yes stop_codon:yes gene_type:complete